MRTNYLFIVLLILFAAVSLNTQSLHAQEQTPTPTSTPLAGFANAFDLHSNSEPTLIDADSLSLDAQARTFEYLGNVKVTQGEMTLTSDKLDGSYSEKNEIQTLTALNNVQITKPDGTKATGQKAFFNAATQTVLLTESPSIEQNGSVLTADKITIYLQEDRSEATGQVRVKLLKKASGESISQVVKGK